MCHSGVLTRVQQRRMLKYHLYSVLDLKVWSAEEGVLRGFCPSVLFRVTGDLKVFPS
jgi:hypothetical protein